ncbi:hypothetical protein FNV43_RR14379 [Rhamnella rubrinervis]|uniref:DNA repair protein UVH3 n=1 Tax=Rhamnella rubrinervis TaxID=2594499 RepID=A0A8K0H2U0_9ROSA|nr:hypothetical protein FNV43_RR14379 [Rhamnella rubrinervis]
MGVHGLWELLAPVGRRVSVETLAGKKLAIDASIWMVQFMKAMRDEKGEMVHNAHLIGFFRRICKLLFLRTKPVFVFDGGTPALKRRTVIARRRQRENAQGKVRKTAEKLLLNHLKAMKLKELAEDIKNQRLRQKDDAKGKKIVADQANMMENDSGKNDLTSRNCNQEKLDEMLAASIAAEENGNLDNNSIMSATASLHEDHDDEDEEMVLPDINSEVDPVVLAALNPSMQVLIQKQKLDNDVKGKKVVLDQANIVGSTSERDDAVSWRINQEKLDEMLAASIMAEEDRKLSSPSTSAAELVEKDDVIEDDEDEDEEMILPTMHGEIDSAVLAALPPSVQLDLLVQIRERLMAENRQKYQKVKKNPGKFSELQIQAYLKLVAFRREIDQVQKAANGRGVGGVQTSRIASEANREFIFSSSFSGDKEALTAGRAEKSGEQQTSEEHPSSFLNTVAATSNSNIATGSTSDESSRVFDDNIETYLDERGRVRVSRLRAMGLRMTRDLQRNLDLMKEIDKEKTSANEMVNAESVINESNTAIQRTLSDKLKVESVKVTETNGEAMLKNVTSIEISFDDDGEGRHLDADEDVFASLVAGNPEKTCSDDNAFSRLLHVASDSDCEWEEGTIEGKGNGFSVDFRFNSEPLFAEGNISDDGEVEWEEGVCGVSKSTSHCQDESGKVYFKGHLEEEANLQEAIKRSLEDIGDKKSNYMPEDEKLESSGGKDCEDNGLLDQENKINGPTLPGKIGTQQNKSTCKIVGGVEKLDAVGEMSISQTIDSPERMLKSSVPYTPDDFRILISSPCEGNLDSSEQPPVQYANERTSLYEETANSEAVASSIMKEFKVAAKQHLSSSNEGHGLPTLTNLSDILISDITDVAQVVDQKNGSETEKPSHLVEMSNPAVPLVGSVTDELVPDIHQEQKLAAKIGHENLFQVSEHNLENSASNGNENVQFDDMEANLEEEMRNLSQERMNLGDEQRRLERNAECVSSEMFIECQELLQMFGLPYIIAPMEAEAQCAYMELANLVDGVVTDDSDVFLFGAQSVYKNIFDDRKYVETYFMKLGLTRDQLVRMALLLGSDYTEGVSGIGIVNAIEVVNAFPEEDGLQQFRDWIESPDPTILGKFEVQMGSESASHGNKSQAQEQKQAADHIQEIKQIFMDKHRKVSKNWHIPPSFPSEAVVNAYTCPQVDKSTEPFVWGKPDHFVLRKLCWEKFGWGSQKADELLLPVLKEYNKNETQLRLEAFYTFNERFAKIRSKRINKAVKGITGKRSSELTDEAVQGVSKGRKKRRSRSGEPGDEEKEKQLEGTEEIVFTCQSNNGNKATPKQSRKRKKSGEGVSSEPAVLSKGRQSTEKQSHVKGRERGRGRGRVVGRGKGKRSLSFEVAETYSSDSHNDNHDAKEVHMETSVGPHVLRKSMRSRKPVEYAEIDDLDESVNQSYKKCLDEEVEGEQKAYCGAASGVSENEPSNVTLEEEWCKNYLETGGGFCAQEGEEGQPEPGVSQHGGDPSYEAAEFSKDDYLKMGGGFCMDEGGGAVYHDEAREVEMADDLVGITDAHDVCEPSTNEDHLNATNTINDEQAKAKSGVVRRQDNATTHDDARTIPVDVALSAMPRLKRKRRKS